MEIKKLFLVIFVFLIFACKPQKENHIITCKLGNKFFFSGTHLLTEEEKEDLIMNMDYYVSLLIKLDKYYALKNLGENEKAKTYKESDTDLAGEQDFGLGYIYLMATLYENNILFEPLVQCQEYDGLISLSIEELNNLEDIINQDIEVKLTLEYIDLMTMNNTEIFRIKKVERVN